MIRAILVGGPDDGLILDLAGGPALYIPVADRSAAPVIESDGDAMHLIRVRKYVRRGRRHPNGPVEYHLEEAAT